MGQTAAAGQRGRAGAGRGRARRREAAAHAAEGTSPPTDLNGDPAYREHLARVLIARALTEAAARG